MLPLSVRGQINVQILQIDNPVSLETLDDARWRFYLIRLAKTVRAGAWAGALGGASAGGFIWI